MFKGEEKTHNRKKKKYKLMIITKKKFLKYIEIKWNEFVCCVHFKVYKCEWAVLGLLVGLSALTANATRELNVLWHDGHTLGVDGTQVGVLK